MMFEASRNDRWRPQLIVSGGQTGADQGGLDAACTLGIAHDGYCPKGRRSEAGPIPAKYQLREHPSSQYPPRTRANIEHSNGTLIFTYGIPKSGSALTVKTCIELERPYAWVDLTDPDDRALARHVRRWLIGHGKLEILNIAGSRESVAPGIQARVAAILKVALGEDEP